MSSPERVVRVPRKRSETRPRILASARQLITERGLDRVSVEAIAEHAGYTRGAFYSNFASMEVLLLTLYEQHSAELISHLRSSTDEAAKPAAFESVEAAIEHVVSSLPFDVQWFRIRTSLAAQADPEPRRPRHRLRPRIDRGFGYLHPCAHRRSRWRPRQQLHRQRTPGHTRRRLHRHCSGADPICDARLMVPLARNTMNATETAVTAFARMSGKFLAATSRTHHSRMETWHR